MGLRPGFNDDPYLSSVATKPKARYWNAVSVAVRALSPRMKFLFACALVALWAFPSIAIEERIWSNAERRWVTFQEDYEHKFFTTVDYGERPMGIYWRSQLGDTVRALIQDQPDRGFLPRVERRVSVNWITQGAETALFLFVLIGAGTVSDSLHQEHMRRTETR